MIIAGIGSRETPDYILGKMELIGQWARQIQLRGHDITPTQYISSYAGQSLVLNQVELVKT